MAKKKAHKITKLLKTTMLQVSWSGARPRLSVVTAPNTPIREVLGAVEWTSSSFWGGDDLIEGQRAVNLALVNLWRALEWQSHGQPFVLKQVAVSNGLAANVFELEPRAESAAAKHAENKDLIEARQDAVELWRGYEHRLFDVVRAVWNVHRPDRLIPKAAKLQVDFGEIGEAVSEKDRMEGYARRVALGIWSPVDVLMADNPDVRTREDALAILLERQAEASELSVLPPPPLPGDEDYET